jgi:hypothetical protein
LKRDRKKEKEPEILRFEDVVIKKEKDPRVRLRDPEKVSD